MKKKAVNLLKTILLILLLCIPVLQFGNGVGVQAATKLATPKLVSAKAQGTSKIKVTWKKVSGADGYKVYRKTWHSDDKWRKIVTLSGSKSTYTDSKLKSGTLYFYTVRATAQTASSNYDKNGLYAVTALNKVTGITTQFSSDNKGIIISWNKIDRSDGYYVYRRTENTSWKAIKKTESAFYIDKNIEKGVQYYYTVCPYCEFYSKIYKGSYDTKGVKAPIINIKRDLREYYEKLENYIQLYGYYNSAYNKVIAYQMKDLKEDKERYAIIYDQSKDVLYFNFTGEYSKSFEVISIKLKLPEREIYSDDLDCEIDYTYYDANFGGQKIKASAYFNGSNYTGENINFTVVQNSTTFNEYFIQKHCNELLYKTLKTDEEYLLKKDIDLSLKKLGFNKI